MNDSREEEFLEEYEEEFRYFFTVRQEFGKAPVVDCFHKLQFPSGLSEKDVLIMRGLDDGWMQREMDEDARILKTMMMRLRFNTNMFGVCLINTKIEINREDLDQIISCKFQDKSLNDFLESAKI